MFTFESHQDKFGGVYLAWVRNRSITDHDILFSNSVASTNNSRKIQKYTRCSRLTLHLHLVLYQIHTLTTKRLASKIHLSQKQYNKLLICIPIILPIIRSAPLLMKSNIRCHANNLNNYTIIITRNEFAILRHLFRTYTKLPDSSDNTNYYNLKPFSLKISNVAFSKF